jgi:AcrR family transcriptional regulator
VPVVAQSTTTRRERRKQEVRSRILEAANVLFDRQGVAATKVTEICDRADVAHKTFFNHFVSKQQLVRGLAEASLEELLDDIARARRQGGTTSERIEAFFDTVAASAAAAGPMHRELLTEIIQAAQTAGSQPDQARRLHAAFAGIVDDGVRAGDVTTRHSPDTLAEMVMGAFYSLMFNWANFDGYPIAERAQATARFLADALAPRTGE